jgi:hypothetical protein
VVSTASIVRVAGIRNSIFADPSAGLDILWKALYSSVFPVYETAAAAGIQ